LRIESSMHASSQIIIIIIIIINHTKISQY